MNLIKSVPHIVTIVAVYQIIMLVDVGFGLSKAIDLSSSQVHTYRYAVEDVGIWIVMDRHLNVLHVQNLKAHFLYLFLGVQG